MSEGDSNIIMNCQHCGAQLMVPQGTTGRRARCSECGYRFVVPPTSQILEETVSDWIVQDVSSMYEDDAIEELELEVPDPPPVLEDEDLTLPGLRKPKPAPRPAEEPAEGEEEPARASRRDTMAVPDSEPSTGQTVMGVRVVAPPTPAPQSRAGSGASAAKYAEVSQPDPGAPIPRLAVVVCDNAGVRFRFDSRWLEVAGFRASMPMKCIFSGSVERRKLIARPLVFVERSRDEDASVEKITKAKEWRELGDRTGRDVVRVMGQIERMAPPFNMVMPYYVAAKYSHLAAHSISRDETDGRITCEVLVPDARCALEWLSRVNGVCGREYELLEQDVALLHGDAWRELPEEVRQRIAVWCKLGSHEVFKAYFSDADFGRHDRGLAGMVITDQRVVFCKYHHRGQVRRDDTEALINVKSSGQFYSLALHRGTERIRMVKVGRSDIQALVDELNQSRGLEVTMQ